MTFENLKYEKDADGIVTITWDMPNRTMNVLSQASMTDFAKAVDMAASDDGVTGVREHLGFLHGLWRYHLAEEDNVRFHYAAAHAHRRPA